MNKIIIIIKCLNIEENSIATKLLFSASNRLNIQKRIL